MMEGILSSFISSICLSVCGCHSHLYLSYRCKELLYQTFLRAVQPNCNNFFQTKKTNSSLYLFIYEWRNTNIFPTGFYFKNNWSIMNHGWRVSDANFCKPQKVPGHNHEQPLPRWWHFCRLSTNENFPFLDKFGNKLFTFFQRCLHVQPLYFSRSSPPTQSSLPFCTGVQFSSHSIRTFKNKNSGK